MRGDICKKNVESVGKQVLVISLNKDWFWGFYSFVEKYIDGKHV